MFNSTKYTVVVEDGSSAPPTVRDCSRVSMTVTGGRALSFIQKDGRQTTVYLGANATAYVSEQPS